MNPIVTMIQSGIKDPAFTLSRINSVISLIQSGIKNPAFTPTTRFISVLVVCFRRGKIREYCLSFCCLLLYVFRAFARGSNG